MKNLIFPSFLSLETTARTSSFNLCLQQFLCSCLSVLIPRKFLASSYTLYYQWFHSLFLFLLPIMFPFMIFCIFTCYLFTLNVCPILDIVNRQSKIFSCLYIILVNDWTWHHPLFSLIMAEIFFRTLCSSTHNLSSLFFNAMNRMSRISMWWWVILLSCIIFI